MSSIKYIKWPKWTNYYRQEEYWIKLHRNITILYIYLPQAKDNYMEKDLYEYHRHGVGDIKSSCHEIDVERVIWRIMREQASHHVDTCSRVDESDIVRMEHAVFEGIMSNLSIEELADRCCCSLSTFKRRFHNHYHISPHRWMLRCRLELAKEVLMTTPASITDIAMRCGFVNNSHFIATFRRHFNITPLKFRRQDTAIIEPDDEA